MDKLIVLFAVCFFVLFAAAISAAPSFTMDFVGEFRAGRPAIIRVTTTDIDLTSTVTINPKIPTGDDADKTYWDTNHIASGSKNIVSSMNQDILQQNNFYVVGLGDSSIVICVDEATHRPLIRLNYNSGSTMFFSIINQSAHGVDFPVGKYGSFTFLCPMTILDTQTFTPESTTLTATFLNQSSIDFFLTPPAEWSWRQPLISINSASYSANTGNLLGGKVKFQFSTDTAGIHNVSIRNGPQAIFYNRRNQEFTSYQCGDNVEAYIISGDTGFGGPTTLQIHVKDSAANGASITCTVDVDGYMTSAFTERSQLVIEMDTVLVAQGIDFPVLDASFFAFNANIDGTRAAFMIIASDLKFSASPLHTNSTVEIRFTGIDVNTIRPTKTGYRQYVDCSDLGGTFSHDSTSVFIKDISQIVDTFSCYFNFLGSKIVHLDELTPVPTVQVLVDGIALYNRAVRSTTFPFYLPVRTQVTNQISQIYQDDSTIKHVVDFSLVDQSNGIVPQKPMLALSYDTPATWPTDSYADVLSCEATSPSSSAYTPLVMTFDLALRTWTADLSSLIYVDAYQINFRCTRSEAVVTKFDIVQNTANALHIVFFDVVSGKGYLYFNEMHVDEQPPKPYLKYPTSPTLPTDFTQYFKLKGSVFITDFATTSSVADDVSTKALAVIQAGYDAYDSQSATPAKLSAKLVNKATISIDVEAIHDVADLQSKDYSPSFAQIMYNFYYTILGFQFQQAHVGSIYGSAFSYTAHSQRTIPKIDVSQYFTSGSTFDQIQALSNDARTAASSNAGSLFYKEAYSTSPAIPFTFDSTGFGFASFSQESIMNTINSCGYYQVGYTPVEIDSDYKFDYDQMISQTKIVRFTCAFAAACSSDADCGGDFGYCSKGTCAVKPFLKSPYILYSSIADLFEYDSYNHSIVASLSAIVIAVIVTLSI